MTKLQKILRLLSLAKISISICIIMSIIFLLVPQAEDALIALGNFGNFFQYLFFTFIGILWALSNWYWPRVFFYMEYHKEQHLSDYELKLIKYIPRLTGAYALIVISIATISESIKIPSGTSGKTPLLIIGIIYIIITVLFLLFVTFRRNFLKLGTIGDITSTLTEVNGMIPFKNLPLSTKKIILSSTFISIFLLLIITISPIISTSILGDAATLLLIIFTIWIPPLYWIRYLGLRYRKPSFIITGIIILIFSIFNSNKNIIEIQGDKKKRENVTEFYTQNFPENKPNIYILSEGGGIRAAYWSSALLSGINNDIKDFETYIYGISGVSGGTFGATIYNSLLNDANIKKDDYKKKVKEIVGKDYLSPVIGAMFTRGVLQLFIPVPISMFDHAKVFEITWERVWEKVTGNNYFSKPVEELWEQKKYTPSLFINITRVEDGIPFTIGSLKTEKNSITKDLYSDNFISQDKSFKISTASLLSARFPYVGPAGILKDKKNNNIGLVDGGYFDNSGANIIFDIISEIDAKDPIVIYITNNNEALDLSKSGNSLLYQLMAPIYTMIHIRKAYTLNSLEKLKNLVSIKNGKFYTFSLDNYELKNKAPLGWSLSETTQKEIENRVKVIINNNKEYLELKEIINNYKDK